MLNAHSISDVRALKPRKTKHFKIQDFVVKLKGYKPHYNTFGIDPGYGKFGYAIILFISQKTPLIKVRQFESLQPLGDGVERISALIESVEEFYQPLAELEYFQGVIENAAFSRGFGQAGLAEARTAQIVGAMKMGANSIRKVGTSTIQKAVFGNGHDQSKLLWQDYLPPDASMALACALYPNFVEAQ